MTTVAQLLTEKKRWAQRDAGPDRIEDIHTIDEMKTVLDAAHLMNEHRIGALIVIDKARQPVGIITERDILRRIVAVCRDPKTTTVAKIMTTELLYCLPDCSLDQARHLMAQKKIRHIPVVDDSSDQQKLVGMVSIGDLNAVLVADLSFENQSMRQYILAG